MIKMKKYSKEVDEFLRTKVLPILGLNEYSYDNIGEIVSYIFGEIEGPLCDKEEAGDLLSEKEAKLLSLATTAITEITTRSDWE